ncbi:MAG: DUF5678 domain-containing protein [Planctomycetota bacterium]
MNHQDPDFKWLAEHSLEIFEKYAGKWIAVSGSKVVAVGDTATEVDKLAREAVHDAPFFLEAIDANADVIYASS